MEYEKTMIENLLKQSGINHKLNNRIKPSKHPIMKRLEVALKSNGVNYMYFNDTDSLAVTQVEYGENSSLCHTLMMPSALGINILMVVNNGSDVDRIMGEMAISLDNILPDDIPYSILGVI